MSTQQKKKQKKNGSCEDTHTFAAEYENAKVNTSCPRYDHTHGRALTHNAGMLQVQTRGRRGAWGGSKRKTYTSCLQRFSCGELTMSKYNILFSLSNAARRGRIGWKLSIVWKMSRIRKRLREERGRFERLPGLTFPPRLFQSSRRPHRFAN